jgi:hypothetical protein
VTAWRGEGGGRELGAATVEGSDAAAEQRRVDAHPKLGAKR